jgi:DNA adenine methylase
MQTMISPLRYPGSKVGLVDYVSTLLNENLLTGCHFYECYAGGASLGLALLGRGVISKLTLIEKDPLLSAFWEAAVFDSDRLCERIRDLKVTIATWKSFTKYRRATSRAQFPTLDLAVAGLFFNRTNFSGVLSAGPIGGMKQNSDYRLDCRFNKSLLISRITTIAAHANHINVAHSDAITYLRRRRFKLDSDAVGYLDPPYFGQGSRLYRYHFGERQHQRLAKFVCSQSFPWLVSYDPHPEVKRLFNGQRIIPISLNYAVKESRRADELLISNLVLPEPVYGSKTEPQASNRAA